MTEYLFTEYRLEEVDRVRAIEREREVSSAWKAAFRTAWKGCGPQNYVVFVDAASEKARMAEAMAAVKEAKAAQLAEEKRVENERWAKWVPAILVEGGGQ